MADPETERLVNVLRTATRLLGITNREVEKKLGLSYGYLSRLFNGTIKLRAEHIVQIAHAIGLQPAEFFQLAYPRGVPQPTTPPASRLYEMLQAHGDGPLRTVLPQQPPAHSQAEIEKMMTASIRKLLRELGTPPESE
jgi:cyanate lyase